jgi:presenilin-like A22 family membrane protease
MTKRIKLPEDRRAFAIGIAKAIIFVACIAAVIIGQKTVGWGYLALMLGGLAGLLALLWSYNRRYQ